MSQYTVTKEGEVISTNRSEESDEKKKEKEEKKDSSKAQNSPDIARRHPCQ
jgi:hypothetical protein